GRHEASKASISLAVSGVMRPPLCLFSLASCAPGLTGPAENGSLSIALLMQDGGLNSMKYAKAFLPIMLALIVGACAKPPQADIDAARTAVADAAKNADVVAYAPDTLKSAQDKLGQMETELTAKHYDKVKSLALDAKTTAGTAANDAAKGKAKTQADATALIAALQQALPDALQKLAAANKVRGI